MKNEQLGFVQGQFLTTRALLVANLNVKVLLALNSEKREQLPRK